MAASTKGAMKTGLRPQPMVRTQLLQRRLPVSFAAKLIQKLLDHHHHAQWERHSADPAWILAPHPEQGQVELGREYPDRREEVARVTEVGPPLGSRQGQGLQRQHFWLPIKLVPLGHAR